ncbi:MAG: hypothetical protein GY811_00835, partial [Myxococcales bacterium]|nr:hypothetical protein [Myxococcales bacterium]
SGSALGTNLDWYTYEGSDDLISSVDPTVEDVTPTDKVEVCMFFDCIEQSAARSFTCPAGSTAATDGGLAGCCGNAGFTVDDLDCAGVSDDADVYIRVKAIATDVCESYSIGYHY